MIADLPYSYVASVVPPGCRVPQPFAVRDFGRFEVARVEPSDAPVACSTGEVEHRSWEGRSYVRAGGGADLLLSRLATLDAGREEWLGRSYPASALASHFRGRRPDPAFVETGLPPLESEVYRVFAGHRLGTRSPFRMPTLPQLTERLRREAKRPGEARVVDDARATGAAEAQAAWREGLLVVGDEAWVRAEEPRYVLSKAGRVVSLVVGYHAPSDARWSLSFRADRLDEARDVGRTLARRGSGSFDDRVWEPLEVLDASALAFDEAVDLAETLLGRCYGFHDVRVPTAVVTKRRAGDRTWAVDLLDQPDVDAVAACAPPRVTAAQAAVDAVAARLCLEAWRGRARRRDPDVGEEADLRRDEDALALLGP